LPESLIPQPMNNRDYETAIEWDIPTWTRALKYWEQLIISQRLNVQHGLELGSRHGGLSYFFAKTYDSNIICSDYKGPSEQARTLHRENNLMTKIEYASIDATAINLPDSSMDFIVFKSMLGAIGSKNNYAQMEKAISEMHRVLKPGGVLFFAENLKGSYLHQFARRKFVKWGKKWHYLSIDELKKLLSPFSKTELRTTGFSSAFCKEPPTANAILSYFDSALFFLPSRYNYVSFGYAVK